MTQYYIPQIEQRQLTMKGRLKGNMIKNLANDSFLPNEMCE